MRSPPHFVTPQTNICRVPQDSNPPGHTYRPPHFAPARQKSKSPNSQNFHHLLYLSRPPYVPCRCLVSLSSLIDARGYRDIYPERRVGAHTHPFTIRGEITRGCGCFVSPVLFTLSVSHNHNQTSFHLWEELDGEERMVWGAW